jgi:hypothetical protein
VTPAAATRAPSPSGTPAACVEASGLTRGQIAALRYHGGLDLRAAHGTQRQCPWRITGVDPSAADADPASLQGWQLVTTARRPTDARDNLRLYKAIP